MERIPPENWLIGVYGRAEGLADVLREPRTGAELQTQIENGEVVRLLGHGKAHALVMKFDGTIGWVEGGAIRESRELREFEVSRKPSLGADEFFRRWEGTPYLWGGVTTRGIDCSGFTQRYFLEVHGRTIPKNSRDQRKGGIAKPFEAIAQDDLIFCHRKGGDGTHHVALFAGGAVWHARLGHGVVRQSLDEFKELYEIEQVVKLDQVQVITAVIERDGRYLVGKRAMYKSAPGYWCPISGAITHGETEREAVKREVFEEIGVEVEPGRKICEMDTVDAKGRLHWWLARITSGEPALRNTEHTELRWVTLEELRGMSPVFPEDIEVYEKLERGEA